MINYKFMEYGPMVSKLMDLSDTKLQVDGPKNALLGFVELN